MIPLRGKDELAVPASFFTGWDFHQEQVTAAHREFTDYKARWERRMPVNPGDHVSVNGYSYVGREMIVDRIFFRLICGDEVELVAEGFVLKKDGSPSRRKAWSMYRLVKE